MFASAFPTVPPAVSPPGSPPVAVAGGLNQQQVNELLLARERAKKLRRAGGVARFDAWMIAIFAAISGLTGIFNIPTLLLAAGMGYVAWREFRGVRDLQQLQPNALRGLATNQLMLAGLLIAYSLWQAYASYREASSLSSAAGMDPQLTQMIGPVDDLVKMFTLGFYGLLIVIAIFAQGGTALYYHTRQRFLDAYIKQTPPWIVELQKQGVSI